jgi:hypothetical protein
MVGVVCQLIGEVARLQKENEKLNATLAALKVENGLSAAPVDHRCGVVGGDRQHRRLGLYKPESGAFA